MTLFDDSWGFWPGVILAGMAAGYALTAGVGLLAARARNVSGIRPIGPLPPLPPVTVLKPLHGADPTLEGCLRSFCEQDYPGPVQLIFGVAAADDPAVAVVRRLQQGLPDRDLLLVCEPTQHGASGKVSNLINMMGQARHDHLVLADADVVVPRQYLARQVAPLLDPQVGIVTCAYRGRPHPGLWSQLGALFINDWFLPSVQVAALLGSREFAFGASIALRRDALSAIGGFEAIASQLADDYRLGELTRARGLATVLSEVIVETWVDEPTFGSLAGHCLRWLRTIRAVRPGGYALSFVTFYLPVALLGTALAGGARPALVILGLTCGLRVLLHCLGRSPRDSAPPAGLALLWLLPLADLFGFALWCWSFTTRRVQWGREHYRVARDGSLIRSSKETPC